VRFTPTAVPRRRWPYLTAALVVCLATALWVVGSAFADAADPVPAAASARTAPGPTADTTRVTVSGKWLWSTHGTTDCNFDRAGVGYAVDWGDPNGVGNHVTTLSAANGGSIDVGVLPGDPNNPADNEAHPTRNEPGTNTVFNDPNVTPPTDTSRKVWRGGCGHDSNGAAAGGSPTGDWGGVELTTGAPITCTSATSPNATCLGASHVYTNAALQQGITICAIMYDVHGSDSNTTSTTQTGGPGGLPKGASEITAGETIVGGKTVKGNQDNGAIKNSGTPLGNTCAPLQLFVPTIVTSATGASLPGSPTIHDTATISGSDPALTSTVTFNAYLSSSCTGAPDFTNQKIITGNGSVTSDEFTPVYGTTYYWQATYAGKAGGNPDAVTSVCGDLSGQNHEVSNTGKAPVGLSTNVTTALARIDASGNDLTDTATLTGGTSDATGVITFTLYPTPADCLAGTNAVGSGSATVDNGADNKQYTSSAVHVSSPGTYVWLASYGGDEKNSSRTGSCTDANETSQIIDPKFTVKKTPASQSVPSGGTLSFNIRIENTGDVPLTNLVVTDANAAGCAGTALSLAVGAHIDIPCTVTDFTGTGGQADLLANGNSVTACADAPAGSQICHDDHVDVGLETLSSSQDFKPKDSGIIAVTGTGVSALNGTLTFTLYKGDCDAANLLDTLTVPVSGDGTYDVESGSFLSALVAANSNVPQGTGGVYNWQITYSDDSNGNADIVGACGTEHFEVTNG
jgi:uncharacterized repeat protein (TIGR01451 family)